MTNSQGQGAWGVGGVRLVAKVHLSVRLRQPLRSVLVLERQPRRPEVLLGLVDAAGAAEWRAGNVDLHVPDQTSGVRSLA